MTSDFVNFTARLRGFFDWFSPADDAKSLTFSNAKLKPPQDGDHDFNELAVELFRLHFAANTPYRKICEARDVTPDAVKHWMQVPAVPTSAFKELELSCLPAQTRTRVFHSSGTTEQRPSRHFHSAESLEIYEASLWPWFAANVMENSEFGVRSSELLNAELLILTPPPLQAPNSSLVHMFDVARRKLDASESVFVGRIAGDGSWVLDFDAALDALNSKFEIRNPKLILGTAFSFVHLLDLMGEKNLQLELPTGSRVLETGGYKGRSRTLAKAELHALITDRLGISPANIICEYGMSELSSQAYAGVHAWACKDNADTLKRGLQRELQFFHFPPWARARVISPETGREVGEGETGLLRVFDLANVFSVMAIQTEDLAVRRGDGFELIGRAERAEPRGCSLMAT